MFFGRFCGIQCGRCVIGKCARCSSFLLCFLICALLADVCGGGPCRAAAVSCLAFVVASRAVLTWRAGEGGGLILPALAKSAPTLPSPPRHPGTARCAACGGAGRNAGCFCSSLHRLPACSFSRVTPHSGAGVHGFARARGEPSDNLCLQRAEDGSPLERAQSEVTPPLVRAHSAATPPQPGRPPTRGHARSITPLWSK